MLDRKKLPPPPKNIPKALYERVMSGFNLSVATGLAMETLFEPVRAVVDPDREVPEKLNINKDYLFMINCETLYRNLQGSVSKDVFDNANPEDLVYILLEELRLIESLCGEEGGGYLTPYFYASNYDKVTGYLHRIVKKREPRTELQKLHKKKMDRTLSYLCALREDIKIHESKTDYPKADSCLIFSHYPYDLLFYKNFRDMNLLESHTGKIKSRVNWSTKYYPFPQGNMDILPFNRTLLLVFGDKVMFSPNEMQLRKYVIDTAVHGKWTPLTTREKMLFDFKRFIPEPYVVAVLASL